MSAAIPMFIAYGTPEKWAVRYQLDGAYAPGAPLQFPVMQPAPTRALFTTAVACHLFGSEEDPDEPIAAVAVFDPAVGEVHLRYCMAIRDADLLEGILLAGAGS